MIVKFHSRTSRWTWKGALLTLFAKALARRDERSFAVVAYEEEWWTIPQPLRLQSVSVPNEPLKHLQHSLIREPQQDIDDLIEEELYRKFRREYESDLFLKSNEARVEKEEENVEMTSHSVSIDAESSLNCYWITSETWRRRLLRDWLRLGESMTHSSGIRKTNNCRWHTLAVANSHK